jgi:hypothetical protein
MASIPSASRPGCRPALVIIDDVGFGRVRKSPDEPSAAHTLYNLIDRRHGQASTAVTGRRARRIGVTSQTPGASEQMRDSKRLTPGASK